MGSSCISSSMTSSRDDDEHTGCLDEEDCLRHPQYYNPIHHTYFSLGFIASSIPMIMSECNISQLGAQLCLLIEVMRHDRKIIDFDGWTFIGPLTNSFQATPVCRLTLEVSRDFAVTHRPFWMKSSGLQRYCGFRSNQINSELRIANFSSGTVVAFSETVMTKFGCRSRRRN